MVPNHVMGHFPNDVMGPKVDTICIILAYAMDVHCICNGYTLYIHCITLTEMWGFDRVPVGLDAHQKFYTFEMVFYCNYNQHFGISSPYKPGVPHNDISCITWGRGQLTREVKFIDRLQIITKLQAVKVRSIMVDFWEKCVQDFFGRSLASGHHP